ncbi:hypothetical protein L3X38_024801 [Prunus dulcis]|uniref:glucan endo-1,3-beta-D-glucosidase n=1 Tax=Prunus dulcis TaxID=3755 RepID=A0AAD4W0K2_PRUDU|nr:hypothetical protein L3X38_024801 [Prunus dulcis]
MMSDNLQDLSRIPRNSGDPIPTGSQHLHATTHIAPPHCKLLPLFLAASARRAFSSNTSCRANRSFLWSGCQQPATCKFFIRILQTLQALSNIKLIIGVQNQDIRSPGNDVAAATAWVENNVLNYFPDVKFWYIAVGNEINPQDAEAKYVLSAMQNIKTAIASSQLQDQIKVSTAIDMSLLGSSYPPSAGSF